MGSRLVSPLIALIVGVGSGVYVFKPLLESYKDSTGGSFRPEDDHHAAPVPPLPFTNLEPAKTKDGKDLLPPPDQGLGPILEKEQEARRKV